MKKPSSMGQVEELTADSCSLEPPVQGNVSARENQPLDAALPSTQNEVHIAKYINIVGFPNSKVQVNSWTSVTTDVGTILTSNVSPIAADPRSSSRVAVTTMQSYGNPVRPIGERTPTPIEIVEFSPKPVSQERHAREKQLINQPIYESIPNSHEKVRRLADDQQAEQAPSVNVQEGLAPVPVRKFSIEAFLSEHMMSQDRDLGTTSRSGISQDEAIRERSHVSTSGTVPPSFTLETPQVPSYWSQDGPIDAKPPSAGFPQHSPALVQNSEDSVAQPVPASSSFLIVPSNGKSALNSGPVVKINPGPEGPLFLRETLKPAANQLPVVTNIPPSQRDPQMNGTLLTSSQSTEHSHLSDRLRQDEVSTKVAQSTVSLIRHDNSSSHLQYAPNMANLPTPEEARVYQVPQGPSLHSNVQSQQLLIDTERSPATGHDLDKSQLHAPTIMNVFEQPLVVTPPSSDVPCPQVNQSISGVPVTDQRSFVSSDGALIQSSRSSRTEKLPTNVDRISRTGVAPMYSSGKRMSASNATEHVARSDTVLTESAQFNPNLGQQLQQMFAKITEADEPPETLATHFIAVKLCGVGEDVTMRSPEELKLLHEILNEQAKFSDAVSVTTNRAMKVDSTPNLLPEVVAFHELESGKTLFADQPIILGQKQVGGIAPPTVIVNEPSCTKVKLSESQHLRKGSQSLSHSLMKNQPTVEHSAILSPGERSGSKKTTPSEDTKFETDPIPVPRSSSMPNAPFLGHDQSLDQVESYDDFEYASDAVDQVPAPIGLTLSSQRQGTESDRSTARPIINSAKVKQDRVDSIDPMRQMRLKPGKTKGTPDAKGIAHIDGHQVQGPSTEFHSGHVTRVPVSDRPKVERSTSFAASAEIEDGPSERMTRLRRYVGAGPFSSLPAVSDSEPSQVQFGSGCPSNELPLNQNEPNRGIPFDQFITTSETSQIRITKETVNRRVEWDWKRDFVDTDQQINPAGREIGWASINDAYEVLREVRLYTSGFKPPFTLGDQPQIWINLDGNAGVQYDVDFRNPGTLHVGVRANGVAAETTTDSQQNQFDNAEDETHRRKCLPIHRFLPKKSPSTKPSPR